MGTLHNQSGRTFVVDKIIERKGSLNASAFSRIKTTIEAQTTRKDLDALKEGLEGITSDGVITASEKLGLKREWASLENSYRAINEQFSGNDELKDNPAYTALVSYYNQLKAIMDKILADMSSDYTGDDAKKITDLFIDVYNQIAICQSVLNAINEFVKTYTISVTGDRAIIEGNELTAGIYKGGVEQENPEFINGDYYTWKRLDSPDGFTEVHGKKILLSASDLPLSPCRFSVTWTDPDDSTHSLSLIFEVSYGTIKEWAWSNALTEEELKGLMPSAWANPKPDQIEGMKYLWRRESTDNRKTYQYFRETGEEGEPGEPGEPGKPGEPGEDGVSVTSIVKVYTVCTGDALPTQDSVWTEEAPVRGKGQVLWVRDKITYSDGRVEYTEYAPITGDKGDQGEPGEAGGAPKYYYKFTKTNEPNAWMGGGIIFAYGSAIMAVGGTIMTAGMSAWLDYIPQGEEYEDDFLWTKIVWPDGHYDIVPPAQPGIPARDIRIVASNTSFQLTTRGRVKYEREFTFSLERNYVTGLAHWSIDPPEIEGQLEILESDDPDTFKVKIFADSTIQSFQVSVYCEEFEATRYLRVNGVDGGEATPYYFKVYPPDLENGPFPIYTKNPYSVDDNGCVWPERTPEGDLITGDFILYMTLVRATDTTPESEWTKEGIPFYFDKEKKDWLPLDKNSPAYSESMGTVLGDYVALPSTPVTAGAMFGFFTNLAARYITAFEMILNNGGSFHSEGYQQYDIDNNPGKTGFFMNDKGYAEFQNMVAVGVTARDITATGTFETQDSEGTVFKTSVYIENKTYKSEFSNAFVRYYATQSHTDLGLRVLRVPGSDIVYRDWYAFASALDHSQLGLDVADDNHSSDLDYYSDYLGCMIVASGSYNAGENSSVSKTISINLPDVVVVVRYRYDYYSGRATFNGRMVRNDSTELTFSYSPSSNTPNRIDYEIFSMEPKTGDSITISLSVSGSGYQWANFGFDIFYIAKNIKLPVYDFWDGGEQYHLEYPIGKKACFFVECIGNPSEQTRTEQISVDEFIRIPNVLAVDYSEAVPTETYIPYCGPDVNIYDEVGNNLLGSIYDINSLYPEKVPIFSNYLEIIDNIPFGEYETNPETSFVRWDNGGTQSIIYITVTSYNGRKIIKFYDLLDDIVQDSPFLSIDNKGNARYYDIQIVPIIDQRGIKTSSVYPSQDNACDIGSVANRYRNAYIGNVVTDSITSDTGFYDNRILNAGIIGLTNKYALYIDSVWAHFYDAQWETQEFTVQNGFSIVESGIFLSNITDQSHTPTVTAVTEKSFTVRFWNQSPCAVMCILTPDN